jgi:threonine/homoserine/homoserine lactone efflux protein
MNTATLVAFLAASLVLAVTPGPGVIYIVTRTLAQGRLAGASSVAGVACGNMLNAVGAAVGLAALFAVSSLAFTVVKFAGAAYLVWLGVKMLRGGGAGSGSEPQAAATPVGGRAVLAGRVFRDGVLVALLNPKTTIFFAAFLPQFMQSDAPALPQAVQLGAIFVVVAAASDLVYVTLASWLAPRFARAGGAARAGRYGRYASGGALIALGIASAMAEPRGAAR